jgi:putative PIN family toxin of toxin-antitoxin system
MIRVVLDTNIIVSALLQPLGPPAEVLLLALGTSLQMCISGDIFAEYEEVIRRPRFRLPEETLATAMETIRAKALWVRPVQTVQVCSDPDDNIFLECAQAARAAYLVTGNLRHFPPAWQGTEVVTPRQIMEIVLRSD